MMAAGIIEFLATGKTVSDGRLIRFDGANCQTYSVAIAPSNRSENIDTSIRALTVEEAQELLAQDAEITLVDIREQYEHNEYNIGGICRPAGELNQWLPEFSDVKSVFLYCNHGVQSDAVSRVLASKRPDMRIAHLKGGLSEWAIAGNDIRDPKA
jgi:adenylyltransferase/sulfurtransferase